MKRWCLFLLLILSGITFTASAQKELDVNWNPSKKDIAFYDARMQVVVPPFALTQVKNIIKEEAAKPAGADAVSDFDQSISKKTFKAMSTEEKFTYTMIHPEVYSQACAEQFYAKLPQKKIFAQLLSGFSGEEWSERQIDFLKQNRTEILVLLEQSIQQKAKIGLNFKDAYLRIEAWESIPFLITFYKKNKKDKDVLTLLMLLMEQAQFPAFKNSIIYQKLYGDDAGYEQWIDYTVANETLILNTAKAYYDSKNSK